MTPAETNPGQPVISARHVGVSYRLGVNMFRRKVFWALRDVTFDLFAGESLGVVGRNGAGKSTLLRVLGGIISPDRGELRSEGFRASLLSLQVGFNQHLTGRENALLCGMLQGMRKYEVLEKMKDIKSLSDLDDFFEQPLRTYSRGMRTRLGFSVAIHADPDILLLDEVLGVGDMDFRKMSSELLKQKIKSNKTVVLVSHNAELINALCDRAVWIDKGVTKAEGSPPDVIAEYRRSRQRSSKS